MDMAVTDEPAPFSSPSPSSQAGSKRKSSGIYTVGICEFWFFYSFTDSILV